jgi:hypothetical protein
MLRLFPDQAQHSLSTLCNGHKQFITTSGKVMQNAITTSMIAETRKFKTSSKKMFSIRSECIARTDMACTAPMGSPYSGREPITVRKTRVPSVSSSQPASFPTRRDFLRQATRAFGFVSCSCIFKVVFDNHYEEIQDQRAQRQNSEASLGLDRGLQVLLPVGGYRSCGCFWAVRIQVSTEDRHQDKFEEEQFVVRPGEL